MRRLFPLLLAATVSACAFFGKSDPLEPRYYSVESGKSQAPAPAGSELARGQTLKLGSIEGGSHLRDRIAYRSSDRELGFYDSRRWTERPEAFFRRALAHALFEERSLVRAVSGSAPTLEVELTDFDELLTPRHAVRVRARVLLADQRVARFEHTFSVEQPVASQAESFDSVADAMAVALERCVDEIGDRVVAELSSLAGEATSTADGAGAR
jgi:ABC-type uncharacterized transport system auxiliary subunit